MTSNVESQLYKESSKEPVGRMDEEGRIYDAPWPAEPIGRVDEQGRVYDAPWPASPIGRVEADGKVYSSSGMEPIGKVEGDGQVFPRQNTPAEPIGRSDPPSDFAGAALLLLLVEPSKAEPSLLERGSALLAEAAFASSESETRGTREPRRAPKKAKARPVSREDAAAAVIPMQRVAGFAHAEAAAVFWANDPNQTVATYLQQATDDSPFEKNQQLIDQRQVFHDSRRFIVVVGGDHDYLLLALQQLPMADLVLACADEATLEGLGIPVVDESWRTGNPTHGYELLQKLLSGDKPGRWSTVANVVASNPEQEAPPVAQDSSGSDALNVGDRDISLVDARALIAGYCFAEKPGRWETDKVSGNVYGDALPEVKWRRWAHRAYDSVAASPGNLLSGADLLMPVGLNVVQGYGTQLMESLTAAAPLVSEVMAAVPEAAMFWGIDRNEIEPAGTPTEGSVSWALHRSWAILMSVPGCGLTITHKILHHKWPRLFPLIDTQTLKCLKEGQAWLSVYDDLTSQSGEFSELEQWFADLLRNHQNGVPLSRLRLHDIILWCLATGEDAEAIAAGRDIL